MSARRNLDPTSGRPIYMEGVDTPKEAALKVAKFIIEDAYAPRLIADSWEAFRAVGKDAALTREGPGMIFWSGMFPFRIHQVDPHQQLRRYLYEQQERYNEVGSRKYAAMKDSPMSPEEVRQLYMDEVEKKNRIDSDVYRKLRGFEKFGIPEQEILSTMRELRYGKDRTAAIRNKTMIRPSLSPKFKQTMSQHAFGPDRVKSMEAAMLATPHRMSLEDVR